MDRLLPELLAPAGDIEAFDAAINNGADAVYLGVGGFNARIKAANFTEAALPTLIARAHLFGVKVYVTLNTLVKNSEFEDFMATVEGLINAKADAFIVQDIGAATEIKKRFPNAELHASTQLGVHNAEGARIAKELDFSRVVLSRETKLEDVKAVANEGLETEYFIQGALCVAFSGNCYMSAEAFDKSGNRGLCAQPCRLCYEVKRDGVTLKSTHALSTADLCLIKRLKELIDAGVTSFKIEGRLRRAGYVAEAVRTYNDILGSYSNNKLDFSEPIKQLSTAYTRGNFNYDAYLDDGVPQRIIEPVYYNHSGVKIGVTEKVEPFKNILRVTIKSDTPINVGDGLKCYDKSGKEVASLGAGTVEKLTANRYAVITSARVSAGLDVYKTSDAVREKALLSAKKTIPIQGKVIATVGKPLAVQAFCNGVLASYSGGEPLAKAKTDVTAADELKAQFIKTGGTPFVFTDVDVETDGAFVPKSVINLARRTVLEKLSENIIASHKVSNKSEVSAFTLISTEGYRNLRNLRIIKPDIWSVDSVKALVDSLQTDCDASYVAIELPIISCGKDITLIRSILSSVPAVKTLIANNISGVAFATDGYKIIGGFGLNIYNKYALHAYRALGVSEAFIAPEADLKDFNSESGVSIYPNKIPVMTLAHCPYRATFGGDCKSCKYFEGLTYANGNREYAVKRFKLTRCYFSLYRIK